MTNNEFDLDECFADVYPFKSWDTMTAAEQAAVDKRIDDAVKEGRLASARGTFGFFKDPARDCDLAVCVLHHLFGGDRAGTLLVSLPDIGMQKDCALIINAADFRPSREAADEFREKGMTRGSGPETQHGAPIAIGRKMKNTTVRGTSTPTLTPISTTGACGTQQTTAASGFRARKTRA